MIKLQGVIAEITYANEDSGFAVVRLQPGDGRKSCTCVGVMPTVSAGESIAVEGEWESHRKFGSQFSVKSYEIIRPTTREGIAQLLGSGLISHIGPGRAAAIIEAFGEKTLDILDTTPEALLKVPGIGPKIFAKIKDAWERQKHVRELMLFLQGYGVTVNLAGKIYKVYGQESKRRISENPYVLIDDIWGVGFVKADRIAQHMGFAHDSYKRIRAGIMHILQEAAGEGHSFLPQSDIITRCALLLQVDEELARFSLDHTIQSGQLIGEDAAAYLPLFYHAEKSVAEALRKRLADVAIEPDGRAAGMLDEWLTAYQRRTGWQGDPRQIEAVKMAVSSRIFLLTGGPGTGKTTILQVIVALFREQGRIVALAAPTGRAAQRMGSISGLSARTIHRLLEFKPLPGGFSFQRNEANPVEADVIILDEVSMVDVMLMRSFLNAVRPNTMLIFVGDGNQLPSVGAGNILSDMIASGCIPHVHLTTIFRQAAASRIVTAAHEIICGSVPLFQNARNDNCFLLADENPESCADRIVDLVCRRLPSRYGLDPVAHIQVLSPMHKGVLGTQNLNTMLQSALNSNPQRLSRNQTNFYLGDKVMQIRNNYDLEVFNGDIGTIAAIIDGDGLTVNFDGNLVQYESKDLDELVPAYCISIHKSQGCEFRAVVMVVSTQHFVMLQRNLVYTGITRARELCVLVGSPRALAIAVNNNQAFERHSRLGERLRGRASANNSDAIDPKCLKA